MHRSSSGRRRTGQRGASSAEYALLAALVAIIIIGSVSLVGSRTAAIFDRACSSITAQDSSC